MKLQFRQALAWLGGAFALSQLLRLAFNLAISRLLSPSDFGLIAAANVVLVVLAMLSDIGIRQATIMQREDLTREFLESTWALSIIRGFVIFTVGCILAMGLHYFSAELFGDGESAYRHAATPLLIAGLSFTAVLDGFRSPHERAAFRMASRKRIAAVELGSQFVAGLSMLAAASYGAEHWALLLGAIVNSVSTLVLGWLLYPGIKVTPRIYGDEFAKILVYSRWVWKSSVLSGLTANMDRLLLGALAAATNFGLYALALTIYSALDLLSSKLVGELFAPMLANYRDQSEDELRAGYRASCKAVAICVASAIVFMALGAKSLIALLFDHRYTEVGYYLGALSLGLIGARVSLAVALFQVRNDGFRAVKIAFLKLTLTIGLLVILFKVLGVLGVALSFGAVAMGVLPAVYFMEREIFGPSWRDPWVLLLAISVGVAISSLAW